MQYRTSVFPLGAGSSLSSSARERGVERRTTDTMLPVQAAAVATASGADPNAEFAYLDMNFNFHFPPGKRWQQHKTSRTILPYSHLIADLKFGFDAPPEILAITNSHWFDFEPAHPFLQV